MKSLETSPYFFKLVKRFQPTLMYRDSWKGIVFFFNFYKFREISLNSDCCLHTWVSRCFDMCIIRLPFFYNCQLWKYLFNRFDTVYCLQELQLILWRVWYSHWIIRKSPFEIVSFFLFCKVNFAKYSMVVLKFRKQ